ncbi:MAG TPA: hypothetical protein VMV94_13205 [Phycisphaerae bacterium]|nr:hypothetical protein [Phycisphaerae bacterium]
MNYAADTGQRFGRNAAKLAAAVVLLLVAVVIFGYQFRSNDRQAVAAPNAKIKVVCKSCGHEFEMLFSDYQRQVPKGSEPAGGLSCPKCGAKSVQRADMRIPVKPMNGASTEQEPPAQRPRVGRTD